MKQVELAKKLGISKSYLSMILSGQRLPSPELERRLSSLEVHKSEARFSLRGRCPKPLDECATCKSVWSLKLPSNSYYISRWARGQTELCYGFGTLYTAFERFILR